MLSAHNARFVISSVNKEGYPETSGHEVVLLGRSNVGKSTFINKFCKRKKLAYTSSRPGKTQTLNFFYLNDGLTFVDVPGYGYARVSKSDRVKFGEMIEEYLVTRKQLVFAVLLIDFKVGPTKDDIMMYTFLKHLGTKVLIVATKKDKLKNSMHSKQKKMIYDKMDIADTDNLFIYSASNNNDINNVYSIFENLLEE